MPDDPNIVQITVTFAPESDPGYFVYLECLICLTVAAARWELESTSRKPIRDTKHYQRRWSNLITYWAVMLGTFDIPQGVISRLPLR